MFKKITLSSNYYETYFERKSAYSAVSMLHTREIRQDLCRRCTLSLTSAYTNHRHPKDLFHYTRAAQTTARGPYPACQRLFCSPPQPNDFIVMFMGWLLVTRINYLARFKYEWGYTNVILSKRKVKHCLRNIREFLYILVQKRVVKTCSSLLMLKVHPQTSSQGNP